MCSICEESVPEIASEHHRSGAQENAYGVLYCRRKAVNRDNGFSYHGDGPIYSATN
jgi:hypothetical protein